MNVPKQMSAYQIHFIGIGGIGMSGIAELLLYQGFNVSGSDVQDSQTIQKLQSLGAEIKIGHDAQNISSNQIIVYSSAIEKTNPELEEAHRLQLPIMRRAEMLAELMRLKNGIAVAGTHGKTTTTSILATLLMEAKLDPTYVIGGVVHNLKGHAYVGKGDYLIAEADESDGSFLQLAPVYSIITNIDYDHLDFYREKKNVIAAFEQFAQKIPFYGVCALNAHNELCLSLLQNLKKPWILFGIEEDYDGTIPLGIKAKKIKISPGGTNFELYIQDKFIGNVQIQTIGKHNVLNALGAIAIASQLDISPEVILKSISKFEGVGRRFQKLFEKKKFLVLDDYAHHPTEIQVTLDALNAVYRNKKKIVIFEPHRFSRTKDCWEEFVDSFVNIDELYLCPIYPASESPILNIDSRRLALAIKEKHGLNVNSLPHVSSICEIIEKYCEQDAVVITLGAGTIGREVRQCIQKIS